MKTKHQIIENFIEDPDYYRALQDLCFGNYNENYPGEDSTLHPLGWNYGLYTADSPPENPYSYFFSHLFYFQPILEHKISFVLSEHYDMLQPILGAINNAHPGGIKAIIRARANYFPHTVDKIHEYKTHIDYEFSHTSAILSLNTCDGYTKLADGTKIPSVDNQIMFSDGSEKHCSTTTTNSNARFNIVINFI